MAKKRSTHPSANSSPNAKAIDLDQHTVDGAGEFLTSNQGVRINDDHNSLKAGDRGPTLLEDFLLREKITHFDHERIPERVVHARGSGAHGYFELTQSMAKYSRASFLQEAGHRTPVFVRFSTVAGSRGSSDLARDVRGFAVKFYTDEGNFDLVGNNMPVFFIQDAMKFPDLIHAVKPEPHNEIPQAASAHDTFWDFISHTPEAAHMIMWVMSDRALPRSLRMMEGFGVHTFRFINANNESYFIKWHLKPVLGMKSVLWDEAVRISGADPDFHRRDLWESIASGNAAEWDVGVQLIPEKDEHKFDFDLLDPTKLVPEELVPITSFGRLVLDRNPDNFFAEVEQVAFHTGNIVPGIDFTNDPLLQGRLFSYTDTQLIRLGGPNFHEIPINRPINPVHNNQRDGFMRQMINRGKTAYDPNSLGGNDPHQAKSSEGGFVSMMERIDAAKVRARSRSFTDHFSQAAMFFQSQSPIEQTHIMNALRFELGKCDTLAVRERMLYLLSQIDGGLADDVATGLGMHVPKKIDGYLNANVGADTDAKALQPKKFVGEAPQSPPLSIVLSAKPGMKTARIAMLVTPGFDEKSFLVVKRALIAAGGDPKVIAPHAGMVMGDEKTEIAVDFSLPTVCSVLFDAVYVAGGTESNTILESDPRAIEFVEEAYRHCKAIAATGNAVEFLMTTRVSKGITDHDDAIATGEDRTAGRVADLFVNAISQHRNWSREPKLFPIR
ncbi:catalase [Schlesneria paludicola]|uniref:catalase n=1 Tax=Schlesneria paludicola TaxID=360056 RepID=UPI00029AD44A|nr:catalase [Schlesneria paludicola]